MTGRFFKIVIVFSISVLVAFLLFYQKSEPSHHYPVETFLFAAKLYSKNQRLCSTPSAKPEDAVIAPVSLDPSDPKFKYTFSVRKNIDKLLSGNITGSNVKPFANIYEHFKVSHALKIATCENPKAMSTVMMNLMCYLYDEENFLSQKNNIPSTWWSSSACKHRNAPMSYRDVLKTMPFGINYMTVIREPFSRFISAYLNKCIVEANQGIFPGCYNCSTAKEPNCIIERLYDVLVTRDINKEVDKTEPFHYETFHFAPQTWVCRMKMIYKSAIFIRYADNGPEKTRMYRSITTALRTFNVPERNVDFVERSFESEGKTWHATRTMDDRDKLIDSILSNRTLYDMLMDIYKHDYDIFQFNRPAFRKKRRMTDVETQVMTVIILWILFDQLFGVRNEP